MTDEPVELNQFRHEILKLLTHRTESRAMGFDQDPSTVSESRFWTRYRLFEVTTTVGASSWSVVIKHEDLQVSVSWCASRPKYLTIQHPLNPPLDLEGWDLNFRETVTEHIASHYFEGVISHDYIT